MKDQNEFLVEIVGKLSDAGVPYMIAGSYSSNIYGEPRATYDVDIVIEPTTEQIREFATRLEPQQYLDLNTARSAVARRTMFNVIDTSTGWKVDLIVRKDRPFSIEEFSRRRTVSFLGGEIWVVSPEDAILSKLEWAKKVESARQLRDAASVAAVQWTSLDFDYLRQWAAELGVSEELERILQDAAAVQREDDTEGT